MKLTMKTIYKNVSLYMHDLTIKREQTKHRTRVSLQTYFKKVCETLVYIVIIYEVGLKR